jgi:branched-chain amino acid transport system substrate-binding protein
MASSHGHTARLHSTYFSLESLVSIRISSLSILFALITLTSAAPPALAANNAIIVGQAIDLSGPNGSIGRDYVAGITTYFDSINVKGGINGRKIEYVVHDDRGLPADSARIVSTLIKEQHADYLLGAIGAEATQATLAAPAFAESRHVLFAPLADSSGKPSTRALYWRPSIESEFLFLLVYFEKLGIKQVGIALQETPQNSTAFQFLSSEMRKRNMTLAGVAKISGNQATLQGEAQRLSAAGAKLIITIGDTYASAQFLRAYRKHDPSTFVAGTSLTNLTTLSEIAGARATEFTVFSQVVPNPGSALSALQSEHIEMMKRFRDEPVSSVTLEGFAVAKTLVKMMRLGKQAPATMAAMDLGGMSVGAPASGYNMSRYVDIALFKRGGGLMF